MSDPAARVPYALAESLGERVAELTQDPNFGLHLAAHVRETAHFDAGLLLLMASSSVRVALERLTLHQRYWGDGERCRLIPLTAGCAVRYALPGQNGSRHTDECALAEIVIGLRVLSASEIVPRIVRFRHARPRDTREHEALFRCPLEFAAAHTEIELDDATLELSMCNANRAYAAIFEQQVERALERLTSESGTAASVCAIGRVTLSGGGIHARRFGASAGC